MRILDYMLPNMSIADGQDTDRHFMLHATTEMMDPRCKWCGKLELGKPERRRGVHKTISLGGNRFALLKGKRAFEVFEVRDGVVYIVAERGVSGGTPEHRRFEYSVGDSGIELGKALYRSCAWARDKGGKWSCDFEEEHFDGCDEPPQRTIRAVLSVEQTGPLTLHKREHLDELLRLLGPRAGSATALLGTLPWQVNDAALPSVAPPLKVLFTRQYWGGSNDLPKTEHNSDHREDYIYGCVRWGGGKHVHTFGAIGWQKWDRLDGEWVLMRRTIWHEVVPEKPGSIFYPEPHCGLNK